MNCKAINLIDGIIADNERMTTLIKQLNAKIEVKDKRIVELETQITRNAMENPDRLKEIYDKYNDAYLKGYKDGLDYAHNFVAKYLNEVRK